MHMWFEFVEKDNSNSINSFELQMMPSSSHFLGFFFFPSQVGVCTFPLLSIE